MARKIMRRKRTSRLALTEEKKNIKKAYLYVILSVVTIGFLFFLGLPLLIKFASFFTNLGGSDNPIDISDNTPPAPPQFENLPDYTNKKSLNIEGQSEDGAVVTLSFNGKSSETVANSSGKFSFELSLKGGKNTFFGVAKDRAGNESQETSVNSVIYDNDEPKLTIESPGSGDSFYGESQKRIKINGTTDPLAEVFVNDSFTKVSDEGTFSFSATLSEGINTFEIKSIDKAGNESSTSLDVNFAP
ncbi:hypothetical protein ISR94_01645 [Candidatus Microgenomates bacterium]|nr:hypothetical protein [Candidatus Microgenomates bacterium]